MKKKRLLAQGVSSSDSQRLIIQKTALQRAMNPGKNYSSNRETHNALVQAKKQKQEKTEYLRNNSSDTIYYKPEEGSGIGSLAPGGVLYERIDGAATTKYKDAVIKIPTGASLTVTSEGGADIDFYGGGGLVRMFGYGWITNVPDDNWKPLFEKAKEIGKKNYKTSKKGAPSDYDPWQYKPSRDILKY